MSSSVSIIITNYNYGHYIEEAIDSALQQTHKEIEVIVVDDGSTDNSREILATYGNRIKTVFQANQGLPSARNAGIAIATGEYLLFLDADDILLPNACSDLLLGFCEHPDCGVIFGNSERVYSDKITRKPHCQEVRYFTHQEILFDNPISVSEALIKREILEEIGCFRPELLQSEDNDFWIRASKAFSIFHIDALVTRLRMHGANMSWDQVRQLTWELQMKLAHDDGSFHMRKSLAVICHKLAYEYRIRGEKLLFRKYTIVSLTYYPLYWKNYAYLVYSFFMS